LRVILLFISVPAADSLTVLPLAPIAITAGVLAILLGAAKGMEIAAQVRQIARNSPEPG
jgi:hypothetical protein